MRPVQPSLSTKYRGLLVLSLQKADSDGGSIVEQCDTVAPCIHDVLDAIPYSGVSRLAIGTGCQQSVVLGIEMTDGRGHGEAHRFRIRRPLRVALPKLAACPHRLVQRDRVSPVSGASRKLLTDRIDESQPEFPVLDPPRRFRALIAYGEIVLGRAFDRGRFTRMPSRSGPLKRRTQPMTTTD
ncbi:hypothetical protein [Mycobacterium barrassiae]|uniref:hypothetical protein n=1 Tax=Mycobacterium barrassiae TaxID=319709 RepID=UPI00226580B9|nr:hypothetical protein [Mycobacterium barrassiae]